MFLGSHASDYESLSILSCVVSAGVSPASEAEFENHENNSVLNIDCVIKDEESRTDLSADVSEPEHAESLTQTSTAD